jgi:hypothetical protein
MAVRNSAVVGASINQGELRLVPGFGSRDMDWLIFMPPVNQFFPVVLFEKRTK